MSTESTAQVVRGSLTPAYQDGLNHALSGVIVPVLPTWVSDQHRWSYMNGFLAGSTSPYLPTPPHPPTMDTDTERTRQ